MEGRTLNTNICLILPNYAIFIILIFKKNPIFLWKLGYRISSEIIIIKPAGFVLVRFCPDTIKSYYVHQIFFVILVPTNQLIC